MYPLPVPIKPNMQNSELFESSRSCLCVIRGAEYLQIWRNRRN